MVSITLPKRNGADIVTALEIVKKPTAAWVDKGKDRKTERKFRIKANYSL